jgi:hypothetical protein
VPGPAGAFGVLPEIPLASTLEMTPVSVQVETAGEDLEHCVVLVAMGRRQPVGAGARIELALPPGATRLSLRTR